MKFLHVADLHLDREFEGLGQKVPFKPYEILENIIDQALEARVDFVIFAGDNFHQSKPSIRMQNYFIEQINRLSQAGIKAVIIFGNHDYYRENIYWFDFPDNCLVFYSQDVETKYLTTSTSEKVAISAFSYTRPHISEDKIGEYPLKDYDADYHIGIFHGEIGGNDYAPATLGDMKSKNYDYWALGHIHLQTKLADNIIYPGTPLGRNRKEVTSFVSLVSMDGLSTNVELIDLAQVHWKRVYIDLEGMVDLSQAMNAIISSLDEQAVFYSLYLKNYSLLQDSIVEVVDSGEMKDSLESLGKIISKISLVALKENNSSSKFNLDMLAKDDIEHVDLSSELALLPNNEEVLRIIDEGIEADIKEDLQNFLSTNFSFKEDQR